MTDVAQDQFDDYEREKERVLKVIKSHAIQLMEHFDSVQIFATKMNNDGVSTRSANHGEGNWFARYGQVKDWVNEQDERTRCGVRNEE